MTGPATTPPATPPPAMPPPTPAAPDPAAAPEPAAAAAPAVICAPMAVEWLALRRAATPVVRTGMGPGRSRRSAAALTGRPVLVAGVCGGLARQVRAGDVVVATEVRGPHGERVACASAPLIADGLRLLGMTVHVGPILSWPRVQTGAAATRAQAATGALAVDTESLWLAPAGGEPFAVVRVVTDSPAEPLLHPGIVRRGAAGLARLRRCVPVLDAWAAAAGTRDLTPDPSTEPGNLRFTLPKEVS